MNNFFIYYFNIIKLYEIFVFDNIRKYCIYKNIFISLLINFYFLHILSDER